MPPTWLEQLREYLCRLYQGWGGDCAKLPEDPAQAIALLWDEYNTHGAPAFPDQASRDAYLQLLSDLETHLDDPQNSLDPADDTSLRNLITQLRSDISPGS